MTVLGLCHYCSQCANLLRKITFKDRVYFLAACIILAYSGILILITVFYDFNTSAINLQVHPFKVSKVLQL